MSEFSRILRRREGNVEHLVLNRPHVRNAFNDELIAEVTTWARNVAGESDVRAVVISGAGPSFCAGADLTWMTRMASYTREENLRDARAAAAMFEALDTLPLPVIARVHGAALGGGSGLAAVADVTVADETATFGFTEVKLGLVPSIISPYVVGKIGESAARELFVTGRRFSAEHAREIGLVHVVVPTEQLDRTVKQYVEEVLANGREAMAGAKTLLRRIAHRSIEEATTFTTETIAERRASAEAQERMRAFLKK
jgi:methylglutaconyl-CoA hydratase